MSCHKGQKHHLAKLTWAKVRQIREKWMSGASQTALAKEHNVAVSTIHMIVTNRNWIEKEAL